MERVIIILLVVLIFSACSHEEGEGGRSTIIGKVFVHDYDSDGLLKDEYYPGDWTVYIIYGNDEVYGDTFKTHYDGTFVFDYLYEGTYTIFAYSKCNNCPGDTEIVSKEVTVGENEIVRLEEDLIVID